MKNYAQLATDDEIDLAASSLKTSAFGDANFSLRDKKAAQKDSILYGLA